MWDLAFYNVSHNIHIYIYIGSYILSVPEIIRLANHKIKC